MRYEIEAGLIIDKIRKWNKTEEELLKEINECLSDVVNEECSKCEYTHEQSHEDFKQDLD